MKLKDLYQKAVTKGIEADLRPKKEIDALIKKQKEVYDKLDQKKKPFFDQDLLWNPFADTRILYGLPETEVKSIIVGIDFEGPELLLLDRLREKGMQIDLAMAHHPEGRAYAHFQEVMDLQADAFNQQGVSLSVADNYVSQRKEEVGRRVHAANHQRSVDVARLLNLPFICVHTPADNQAYQYIKDMLGKEKPESLGKIIDSLYNITEYQFAAKDNNPPKIIVGNASSRCKKIHVEFTGGTEGPIDIYKKLSDAGVDTIIAMHQSEEHVKRCKQENINVIVASHIASDNLGLNLILDYLSQKQKLKVYECSGFRRVERK